MQTKQDASNSIIAPTDHEIFLMLAIDKATALDGCGVDVDGKCVHGYDSWVRHLGIV